VVDNVVWTDSCLSIVGADCALVCIGAGEEQVRKVLSLCDLLYEVTSGLGWRDPVADRIKGGPHGGKKSKTASWWSR
jgi:hypothetical protein